MNLLEKKSEIVVSKMNDIVTDTNTDIVKDSRKMHYTLYGDIAMVIDNNMPLIDELADRISTHLAEKAYFKDVKKYEAESSFIEKYIKNSNLKLYEFQKKSELKTDTIVYGTKMLIKGAAFAASNALSFIDKTKVKKYIWQLCCMYANIITNNNIKSNVALYAYMKCVYNSLYEN